MSSLDAALAYAARGWPVFPCHPAHKRPLVSAANGTKGGGGFKLATVNHNTIRGWWEQWPRAMIGVPTGERVGAFVVDLDLGDPLLITGKEYLDRFAAWCETQGASLPATPIAETGSGGFHIYFAWDPEKPVANRQGARGLIPELYIPPAEGTRGRDGGNPSGAHLDTRGEGGYVIVPPSVRDDGRDYVWAQPPDEYEIARAPEYLLNLAAKIAPISERAVAANHSRPAFEESAPARPPDAARRYALAALDEETRTLMHAPAGTRSDALNHAAFNLGQLIGAGALMESMVRSALEQASVDNGHVQKDGIRATRATIDSGLRAGIQKPRDLEKIARARQAKPRPALHVVGGSAGAKPRLRELPEPKKIDQFEMRDVLRQQRRRIDPPPADKRGGRGAGKWTPDELGLPREDPCPVIPLGIEGPTYHVLDSAGQYRAVVASSLTQAGIQDLFAMTPHWPEWAAPRYGKAKRDPDTGELSFPIASHQGDEIRKMLFRACGMKGQFSPDQRVRGRGSWKMSDGGIMYHAGEELWVVEGGRPRALETGIISDGPRELVFPRMSALPAPWPALVTPDINPARELLKGFRSWSWERPDIDPLLLLGWIGVAFLGGALDWRSAVFLVGDAGSGKSTLQAVLKAIFGDALLDSANTTAAGIYQALSHDSRPVAVDEIEGGADNRKVAAIVELARQASSGAFGRRGASDAGSHGVEFQMRSAFLFSAINTPPLLPQDLSRLAMLRLRKLTEDSENAGAPPPINVDTCGRMILSRLLAEWHRFPATLKAYREQLAAGGHSGRGQDTYGNLLAAADLIIGPELASELGLPMVDDLSPWAKLLHIDTLPEVGDALPNWRSCVNHMLQSRVEVWRTGERATVGQLLEDLLSEEIETRPARRQLAQAGLGLEYEKGRGWLLAVPNQSPMLERLFYGSRWQGAPGAGGWSEAMRQAPDDVAIKTKDAKRVYINGVQQRCTLLVLSALGMVARDAKGDWTTPATREQVAATLKGSEP